MYFDDIEVNCDYVLDKKRALSNHIKYMLDRTQSMFKYEGLPDTIPQKFIELYLQKEGSCFWTEYKNNLYVFSGAVGGVTDEYNRPTLYTVSVPYFNLNENYTIDEDGVLMLNDSLANGLLPLLLKYGTLLVENSITIRTADIMLRIIALISASDDKTKKSADVFIDKIIEGRMSAVAESAFFEGVKLQNITTSTGSYLQQFIEIEQYLKASMYNELGMNANYNMKREAIGKDESQLNDDLLLPLCDNMLLCRQQALEKVNKMFGTNITVDFDSVWKKRKEQSQEDTTDSEQPQEQEQEQDNGQNENESENGGDNEEKENQN